MDNENMYKFDEKLNEQLFDNARDILLIISEENGKILKANKAAIFTYGYSHDELIGMSIYKIRMKEDSKVIEKQMNNAMKEGILFEAIHYKNDGSCFSVEVSSINIGDKDNRILLSIIRDITERKEREEKIRFNENRLRLLYESLSEGVSLHEIITDSKNNPIDFRYININSSFEKIIGFKSEEIIGKTALEIMPNIKQDWIQEVGQVALTGIPKKFNYYEERQGKHLQFSVYSPQKNFFAILFTDITELILKEKELTEKYEELATIYEELAASEEELKDNYVQMEKLKEEADRANKAKSLFLANMSHEIRTPLTGIMGMANLLNFTELNEYQREYVKIIMESGIHLLDIINNILDISKIEAGKFQLNNSSFKLKENIETIIKPYYINGSEKGIDIMFYFQPLIDEVVIGDALRLNQIIVNLMENAFKYTEKGHILLKVKQVESSDLKLKLQFSVQDTGIGIKTEMKDKLFKVFSQGDSSYTKRYGGTGLGLAICKELVAIMNGDIWYESETGVGSTFYFTAEFSRKLEIIKVEQNITMLCEENVHKGDEKCILIAEDNEINLKLVCAYLNNKGYKYKSVTNGKEAIDVFIKGGIKLILMDLQMPDMNGIEATKLIRELEKETGEHIIIIAMTAYAMDGDKQICIDAGMDDYISKPIDVDEFYGKVEKYM